MFEVLAWVLGGVILLLLIVMLSWISIHVDFEQAEEEVEGEVLVRLLFGLVRIRRHIHELNFRMTDEGPSVETIHDKPGTSGASHPPNSHKQSMFTFQEFMQAVRKFRRFRPWIRQSTYAVKQTLRHLQVRSIKVDVELGTGDPVVTGFAIGSAWAVLGTLLAVGESMVQIQKPPQVDVRPNFQAMTLNTDLNCIARMRVGHAMLGILRLLRIWRRAKKDQPDEASPRNEEEPTWSTPSRA